MLLALKTQLLSEIGGCHIPFCLAAGSGKGWVYWAYFSLGGNGPPAQNMIPLFFQRYQKEKVFDQNIIHNLFICLVLYFSLTKYVYPKVNFTETAYNIGIRFYKIIAQKIYFLVEESRGI